MTYTIEGHRHIFSVGHSNHTMEEFLSLLEAVEVEVVVDVRSHPQSKYAPHFGSADLKRDLGASGIKYLYLGRELGGRPDDEAFYDENGYVLYSEWAQSNLFLQGIERLERGIANHRIAMMCSEENPTQCHRRVLITPVLKSHGIEVAHIRANGKLQTETDLLRLEAQPSLFRSPEGIAWKSTHSVLQRRQQRNSSAS